jgi:predicted Rossmann fold nucleotide-binding protein DprA/Smf involved in DNA uptake
VIRSVEGLDRQALILLCAGMRMANGPATPLGPGAWASFHTALQAAGKTPGELLGLTAEQIAEQVGLGEDQAARVAALLGRGGPIAIELERLASRGIWTSTLLDETYPSKLRDRLANKVPPLLFGAGDIGIANQGGIAIIGSRDADSDALEFTASLAKAAARGGLTVISGAARGIDSTAMSGALDEGSAVGVLADALESRIREPQVRLWLADGQLCLVTPYAPDSAFSVGAAMGRNKLIYAMSDVALVVSASEGRGGTWSGAVEALASGWAPVLVRRADAAPAGNLRLIERGAHAFAEVVPESITLADLQGMIGVGASSRKGGEAASADPLQDTLFGEPQPISITRTARTR